MIKCSKAEVRRLETALHWKLPPAQRERIQMVLWREMGMTQPAIRPATAGPALRGPGSRQEARSVPAAPLSLFAFFRPYYSTITCFPLVGGVEFCVCPRP